MEVVGCSDNGVIGMFSAKIRSVHQERCAAAHESLEVDLPLILPACWIPLMIGEVCEDRQRLL